jgi:hypothetical protein
MADIKIPVVELAKDKFQLSVDTSLYAKEVITAAIYKYSHLFSRCKAIYWSYALPSKTQEPVGLFL